MRIYTGKGLAQTAIRMIILAVSLVIFIILFAYGIGWLAGKGSLEELRGAFSESDKFDIMLTMMCSVQVGTVCSMTFEKTYPGGKFFRTVRGGFDTYKKARTAVNIEALMLMTGYYAFAMLSWAANIIGVHYGIHTFIAGVLFTLLSVAASNFFMMIKSTKLRSVSMIAVSLVLPFTGVCLLNLTEGKVGILHYAAGAAGAVLLFVSNSVSLSYYKKTRWDN